MKTLIMSIRRENNRNIESGVKKIELRTLPPSCEVPFRVLTYESGPGGRHAITNEWICDERRQLSPVEAILTTEAACVSADYIRNYTNCFKKPLYGLNISELVVYKKPRSLGNYYRRCDKLRCEGCEHLKYQRVNASEYDYDCEFLGSLLPITRAPQNYCYVAAEFRELKRGARNNAIT